MWSRSAFGFDVREGHVPVVVYAPHAGRRARPVRRGDGVNDLYTGEIGRELADALDAYALLNPTIDRNEADLNRVSVLSSTAEPVLFQLRALVEQASSDGSVPLVLIVHGWNVTMPACDIGIGLTTRNGDVRGSHPTVSRAMHGRFVCELVAELSSRGIEAPLGLRYPASGRDNATQLFSGRHAEHAHAHVSALSRLGAKGGVDAVQLELAIPLRWPGSYRDHFLDAVLRTVGRHVETHERAARRSAPARAPRTEWALEPRASSGAHRPTLPLGWSLQAVLGDGSGLFGGAEPAGANEAAARLCLVKADGRMMLFVGEDEWAGEERDFQVGGLRLVAASGVGGMGDAVRLTYDGPMVIYPSHDAFCDLETGLAGSDLVLGTADLTFEPEEGAFGRLKGRVTCGEERFDMDVIAVCERGSRRSGAMRARSRVFVTRGPVGPLALRAHFDDSADPETPRCECRIDGSGEVSEIGCFFQDGVATEARVLTRVPVYRVLGERMVVKVTFGTAQIEHSEEEFSLALFEHVELITTC